MPYRSGCTLGYRMRSRLPLLAQSRRADTSPPVSALEGKADIEFKSDTTPGNASLLTTGPARLFIEAFQQREFLQNYPSQPEPCGQLHRFPHWSLPRDPS